MADLVAKERPIANVSFYDPKSEAEAKRKRQLADILIQQGSSDFQNEKVGKYVVERSPWELVNKTAQSAYGQYLGAQADNQMAESDTRRQEAISGALGRWGEGNATEAAKVLAQDPRTTDMAVKLMQQSAPGSYGIQSAGFEGDIARAFQQKYMADGMSRSEAAQRAVLDTAQSMKGSWDPVSGNYVMNQSRSFGGANPQDVQTQGMPMQQPTMQAPQGGLLPPPNMGGGQPDMSMFQGQMQPQHTQMQMPSTGNRKLDAEMAQAQAAQNMRVAAEQQIAEQTAMRERQSTLPQTLETAQNNLSVIDQALSNPGLSSSVGGTFGMQGRQAQAFPITQAQRDFQPLATQLQGQSFLQAFQSLKGGGAITEVEGQKATQAIARLQQSQSEESYRNALNELRDIVSRGIERAQSGAMQTPQQQALGAVGAIGSTTPTAPQSKRIKFNPATGMLE